ncbi:MAG TPA: ATP-binding protein [Desulfuromonadales bacterium]|nr:ATP-binding protein [Desulfuromonadales bacterium]
MLNNPLLKHHLQLEQALGTIPSGLFVVDMELRIAYWNPAAERITGYPAEEMLGKHCSFLKGIPCGRRCGLLDPDTPKPIVGVPCSIATRDGKRITIMKNVEMLYDADGNAIGGIESFHDITRLRQLERNLRNNTFSLEKQVKVRTAELEKSEARFRSVLDNMDDFAYITLRDYRLAFMNQAMMAFFGDRIGEPCHLALHKLRTPCPDCLMPEVFQQGTARQERSFQRLNRTYEIIHSCLPGENGRPVKLAVCRDITQRKQAEQELTEANLELDAFASSISHDLRGILSPVITYMDFLRTEYGDVLDPEVHSVLGEVERQSERAVALLNDLLDLAQVGRIEASAKPTQVSRIIEEITREHILEPELPDTQIRVAPDLPATWVPQAMIYQVFVNLIANAIKYAGPAGQPIEIGCRKEQTRLVYYVRDHGPGIAPEERESVFEIFSRGLAAKGSRGTGVGLAIVRKVAMRCRGQAWVEGTPGGGATFCLGLPHQPVALTETAILP